MNFPRILLGIAVLLFGTIAVTAWVKKDNKKNEVVAKSSVSSPLEIELDNEVAVATPTKDKNKAAEAARKPGPKRPSAAPQAKKKEAKQKPVAKKKKGKEAKSTSAASTAKIPQDVDRIQEFFNRGQPKFPIVETVTYNNKVEWKPGRAAWISDYAAHYATSRHFIARSLNGGPDYFNQNPRNGDRFNVLRTDVNTEFYLLIDASKNKMWFYFLDLDNNERTLVKTYDVGLGRPDTSRASGNLTPTGKYSLGSKIAIYKPGSKGYFKGERVEMMRIFGTRWIPFDEEVENCTEPARGYGIHGSPWDLEVAKGKFEENRASVGKNDSDGCIRLHSEDIEELFSIIITKPTTVEIVHDFQEAKLPGNEKLT